MGVYSIVDRRANRALNQIVEKFQAMIPILHAEDNAIELDGSQYGMDSMKAYHNMINKWMGRVYIYTWEFSLPGISLASDARIKLHYRGSTRGQNQAQFLLVSGDSVLADLLNGDPELIQLCNKMDVDQMELKYNRTSQRWTVRIAPNYGDFIWVLIPPMSYARKPTAEEASNTVRCMELLAIHIEHQQLIMRG
ncbi:hypothetical protein ACFQZR_20255 [Paenibacillus sp. GCM10027629]|uniref:hypothetical protein n=1 Tax=Paenibacillus sp. GCM10027629 TaxID=3273414 RepID=UPI00363A62D3